MSKSPFPPPGDSWLAVAHIARPHGVRGEVSAIPLAPPVLDPQPLLLNHELMLRDAAGRLTPVTAEWVRGHQDRWLIKLNAIDDMNGAETLRGHDLCLRRDELPPLPEGWYYEADLVGCRVIDERLGEIGIVAALELGYNQPQLKIRRPDGRDVLVPWRNALFPRVDLAAREIHASLPVGMPGIEDDQTELA